MKAGWIRRLTIAMMAALALVTVSSVPANAFTNNNSITTGGVTYRVHAYSCNLYWSSCSWDTNATLSSSRYFTHRSDVKANGWNVSVTISADAGATITGNSTTLATASESGYGRYNYMAGVARPSITSVSVAARSRLYSGTVYVNSGWTTW